MASTTGLALLTALVGSGGTAAADAAPATHHVSTPGWKVSLSGATAAHSLLSVTSVDADHAWASGWGTDGHGVIMNWDGRTWSPVTDPALPEVDRWSAVSAASADDVWAYGWTATLTGGTQFLAHYDGTQWTDVPAAGPLDRDWTDAPIKAVPGRLFEGGRTLSTYSGGTWQTFALPDHVDIRGIDAVSADDAYATGMQFPVESGHPVAYHWDGTTWTPMPQPPAPASVTTDMVAAESPDSVYVGGWGQPGGEPVVTHVEHWDGSAWHDVTGGLSELVIHALRADGHGGLWATGSDYSADNAGPVTWHYDGTVWTKQAGATVTDAAYPSYTFYDIAPAGTGVVAVGGYPAPDETDPDITTSRGLIEHTQDSLDVTTADLAVSSTATHTVRVHAETPGRLTVAFRPADGQPAWDASSVDLKVTSVSGGPQGACSYAVGPVNGVAQAVTCDLPAGDHTLAYTLASGTTVDARQIVADVRFQPSTAGAAATEATVGFTVESPDPVPAGTRLLGRDAAGTLWRYDGTGSSVAPFLRSRVSVGSGWQGYTAMTALSGLTVHGSGDLVARDAGGVLWYYRGGGDAHPFEARVRVAAGWNIYDALVGAGDLTGDGRADLVARDASGVLWLYKGTGSTTAPLANRVRIVAGWNIYAELVGAADLTGDGKPGLFGRDASGALWLYRGTGNAATPYANRVKISNGWNIYDALVVPGDLTGDGRADILGRDASGVLWLYRGTGNAATPYANRVKISAGWSIYNSLI
ncbi:FG-GAP repeat domain-containing protein [Actinacidiphila bryophytorum]|uniref:FG-GAP repeat domain-containing protein n=1 Tax=Actinacidiphila bryophytorum TaxID=1436133 RepID=UPI002176E6BA|nr:VCBS repeat-containing protein [Actinacidiphila bryophytorum]UWE13028.1 VCBS repeat-containing protein [Actinacidiphila bryophytorum]